MAVMDVMNYRHVVKVVNCIGNIGNRVKVDDKNMAGGAPQHLKISFSWFLMVASFWESDVFSIFSIDNPLDIMNCMKSNG